MNKLYSEKQYKEYLQLMDRMANCDTIEGAYIYDEINQWTVENKISEIATEQMDKRMEKEYRDEMNGVKKEGKVIRFLKK